MSQRKRQGRATLRAVGLSLLAFPVVYWIVLQGFSAWTIPAVIGTLIVMQILNVAADAVANDYVTAEHREP